MDTRSFFWALNLESWILPPWIQEVFSELWILNHESYPLGFKIFFLSFESWILNLESYPLLDSRILFGILNLESYLLGFKKFFLSLEAWILNPTPLDSRIIFGILNLESWPFCTRLLRYSWILDLRFGEECILNAFWMHSECILKAFFAKSKIQDPRFPQDSWSKSWVLKEFW